MTGTRQPHRIGAALEAGAVDHAVKDEAFATLVERIVAAVAGDAPGPGHERRHQALRCLTAHREQQRARLAPLGSLTPRERAVLLGLTRRHTAAQIAAIEWVSENTVRTHIRGILGKLDVTSQMQAVALAFAQRMGRRARRRVTPDRSGGLQVGLDVEDLTGGRRRQGVVLAGELQGECLELGHAHTQPGVLSLESCRGPGVAVHVADQRLGHG